MNATPPWPEPISASDQNRSGQEDANELGIRVEGLDRGQLLALANKVAALLRHELIVERERHGRRGLV